MEILSIIIAAVVGAAIAYLVVKSVFKAKNGVLLNDYNHLKEDMVNISTQKQQLENENSELINDCTNLKLDKTKLAADVEHLRNNLTEEKNRAAQAIEQERQSAEQKLKVQMTNLQELFKNSANELLKEKSKNLSEANSEQMKIILSPLTTKMEEFKKAVEENGSASLKNTTSLETQIKAMMEQTNAISKEAANLASALKSNNKIQGNWGEVVLKNLLEGMGLSMGKDFILQETIRDIDGNAVKNEDSNRKMIPDAVLYLPDNKAIVIDSKVSLSAYIDYCNAENEIEKAAALKRHAESVESHIKELSAKQYGQYLKQSKIDSLEYVIMFVPNEGAFQLFYSNFAQRWHSAFENKIIITGESNLFAMLKVINAAWVQIQQQKNIEDVMRTAGELLDRVAKFVNTFDEVGKNFDKTLKQYEEAKKKLTGRQSIVTTSIKLEKMGVISAKESIRESLRPELEIEDVKQLNTENDE